MENKVFFSYWVLLNTAYAKQKSGVISKQRFLLPRCRKVSSAPAAGHHQSDVHPAKATRGWVSADQLPAEKSIASRHAEGDDASRRTCSNNNNSSAAPPEVTGTSSEAPKSNKRHPPLHVHSNSFPAWPSLSEADPAIDLINTIKAELKKFEHRWHCWTKYPTN